MPQQLTAVVQGKDILGYTRILDRRQVDKSHVLEGRNFLFNAQGPYSGFGRRLLSGYPLADPTGAESFIALNGKGFVFTNSSVLYFDGNSGLFIPVYEFAAVNNVYPWQHAIVAGRDYFCRKGVGVLEYDPNDATWRELTSPYLPVDPCGIAEVRSRLIVLGTGSYAWSAIDDVDDFEPSLTTGAGAQSTLIVGGTPYVVKGIADAFLVFTSKGIAIAEFSGGQAVFRHRVLSRKHVAVSPRVIDLIEEYQAIFMTEEGLFTCDGRLPVIYDPAFSEYLSEQVIRQRLGPSINSFRLRAMDDVRWLILEIGASGQSAVFDSAFVCYTPIKKWGSFDAYFSGFLPLMATLNGSPVFRMCVSDAEGYCWYFSDENYVQGIPEMEEVYYITSVPDPITWVDETGGSLEIHWKDFGEFYSWPIWKFSELPTGFYQNADINSGLADGLSEVSDTIATDEGAYYAFVDGGVMGSGGPLNGPSLAPVITDGLNAYVHIGLVRFNELKHTDEMGMVLDVAVWNGDGGSTVQVEDWLTTPDQSEDWLTLSGSEDWGFGVLNGDVFDAHLIGTNDGTNAYTEEDLILLTATNALESRYPATATGQWHFIQIAALDYPKTFHLKSVEFGGTSAGRLF